MTDTTSTTDASASAASALVEITSEIVAAYITRNAVPPADLPTLISTVHGTLSELSKPSERVAEPKRLIPPVPIRKSVTEGYLVSFEDGKHYQVLKRHLTKLGLTPEQYRTKWGLPADYPMVAPAYARQKSEFAKETGLGQKRRKR